MDDDIQDEFDDFEFDESVFQTLDETERKFNESVAARKAASPPSRPLSDKPPPAKRPRIDSPPPKPQRASRVPYKADDDDDTPVITLDASGKYAFASNDPPQPPAVHRPSIPVPSTSTRPAPRPSAPFKTPQIPTRPAFAPAQNARAGPPHATGTRQATPNLPQSVVRPRAQVSTFHSQSSNAVAGTAAIEAQLAQMQAQLAKLQEANETLSTSLRSAEDARYIREGEVANLRRKMDQSIAQHNAEIARLKQEKLEAEQARQEREKSLKEEMERMKTRFIIRQQELETSTRKRTWSSAHKNVSSSQFPATQQTPVPFTRSSQARPLDMQDTPAPATRRTAAAGKGEKRPAPQTFGGFVNSFQTSSPVRSPSKTRKPKKPPAQEDRSSSPGPAPSFAGAWTSTALRPQETPRRAQPRVIDEGEGGWFSSPGNTGSNMDIDPAPAPVVDDDEDDFGMGPNAADEAEEVHQIVMSHWNERASMLSLQVLLAANQSPEYVHACSMLVRQGGAEQVGSALVEMGSVLASVAPLPKVPLEALLNLCAFLAFSISSFSAVFFAGAPRGDELPPMLHVLFALVEQLTSDVVTFLHALSWSLREEHLPHIENLLRQPRFLASFLQHGGAAALRTISLLASYPSMWHSLLSFPHGENGDMKCVPLIEGLGRVFMGEFDGETQVAALTCIGQLALAHEDARMLLLDQNSLVPALVHLVWNLVARFWDGDASLPPPIAVRVLQQTVHVLHHLAVSREGSNQLRSHLQPAAGELNYMFAVAIGRLSYADPPERLDEQLRAELRKLTEFARDLLEIVVDGPEMDEIYNAYQWDEGEPESAAQTSASVTDDEDSFMEDDFAS